MTRRLTAVDLLRERIDALENKLAASEALLEGMTTEAKRRAEHAVRLEDALLRAHAHHMFGDRPGCDDRMAALGYLRNHGLPEATPADLDAACEGLETPWVQELLPLSGADRARMVYRWGTPEFRRDVDEENEDNDF